MVIGLTGGSGCGKTTALDVLRELGAVCYDADAVYHTLLKTCKPMLREIAEAFPGTVQDGVLQRKKLGTQVFGDPAALQKLTVMTHAYVAAEIRSQLKPGLSVIDAVGLMESGLNTLCDHTVAITAPLEARIDRLIAREGISRDYAAARIAAQRSDESFSESCEFTLCNDGTVEEFRKTCKHFFEKLMKES